MTARTRRWTWTLNNYTPQDIQQLQNLGACCTYIIFGEEIGEQGTPHLQGYLETSTKKSLKQMKEFHQRVHWAPSMGTAEQNKTYCSKDGNNIFESGTPMQQGKRSDLEEVVQAIRNGTTVTELFSSFPIQMIKHHRGIIALHQKISPQIHQVPIHPIESFSWSPTLIAPAKTTILWGAAGIGKTSFVLAVLPKILIVSHLDDLATYNQQEHEGILFDDVSILHLPRTAQIHIVDQMLPRSIHIRYSLARIPANTTKVFTTNELDGQCMLISDPAIRRRVTIHQLIK